MLAAADVHWWYRGRRRILRAELEALGIDGCARLLDAGCGAGQTLALLAQFGEAIGVDPDARSVQLARAHGRHAVVGALPSLPFADEAFSACTCLDVIEHLDDDLAALLELRRVTAAGGALLVSVPAYQALWSAHDEANEHRRRYSARRLRALARAAGWEVERLTYFNSLLLPAVATVRLSERLRHRQVARSDLDLTPGSLNGLLELPLRIEAAYLRTGARLPAGLSLLAVLRRTD